MKRILKKGIRILAGILKWVLIVLIALFLIIFAVWKIPAVHDYALKRATNYFNTETQGDLSIEEIDLRLPFYIGIRGISLHGPDSEKIASIGEIEVFPGWRALFNNTIQIDEIKVSDLNAEIFRNIEGRWNYDFIIEAFASESEPTAKESSWDFSISTVGLSEIEAKYYDQQAGDSLDVSIGSLNLEMKEFSVLESVYSVENLRLAQNEIYYRMGESSATESSDGGDGETALPELGLKFLDISETGIHLVLDPGAPYIFDIGQLSLKTEEIDLEKEVFHLQKIFLANSSAEITMPPSEESEAQQGSESTSIFLNQSIRLASLELNNFAYIMHSPDPADDMNLMNVTIKSNDIRADSSGYYATFRNIRGIYNELDQLKEFHTKIALTPSEARIDDLGLTYGSSQLKLAGSASYSSFENLMEGLVSDADFNIDLISIAPADVNSIKRKFSIPDSVMPPIARPVLFSGAFKGNLKSFVVSDLLLKTGNTYVKTNFTSKGDSIWPRDVALKNFRVEVLEQDIYPYLEYLGVDSSLIPPRSSLRISGNYAKNNMAIQGDLLTSFGDIAIETNGSGWGNKDDRLAVHLSSDSLQISDYLDSPQKLSTDLVLEAEINDVQSDNPSACMWLEIDELLADLYTYNGIRVDASLDDNEVRYALKVDDRNVKTQIGGAVYFDEGLMAFAEGEIEGIDLEEIQLTPNDVRGSLKFSGRFKQDSISYSGGLAIDEILFVSGDDRYDIQPLRTEFYNADDSSFAELNSQFAQLKSVSNRSFTDLGKDLTDYYTAGIKPVGDSTSFWTLDFETGNLEDLRAILLRDLNEFEPAYGNLSYRASQKKIAADIVFPLVNYAGLKLDSLEFHSAGDADSLFANLFVKEASYDSLGIEDIDINLSRIANGARLELFMNKQNPNNGYHLAAEMVTDSEGTDSDFRIDVMDSLVLNGEMWDYQDNGGFSYAKNGIQLDSIEISKNGSSLSFHKEPEASSLTVRARKFGLESITSLVNTQSAPVSGILSGALTFNADGTFMGDGEITGLSIYEAELGRLTWSAEKEEESYRADISNRGDQANFELKGTLTPMSEADSELDLKFNLNKFDAKLLAQLVPSIVAESSGNLTGEIDITGSTKAPIVNGKTNVSNAQIKLDGSNITYKIKEESIEIAPEKFDLNNFTINDGDGRALKINGSVTHKAFDDFKADLNISADEFEILNIQKRANESIYGNLIASIDVDVKGNLTSPDIKANIGISPKTELTYVVSFESNVVTFDESLLVWTDFDEGEDEDEVDILTREKESSEESISIFANNPTLDGKLNIDKNATFNVIVDSVAGDYLTVKGGGVLGINYNKTGNLRFSGNYEVTSGFYQMTFYDLVKKRFNFQKGSRLVWNGEPTNATLDITALYKTRTGIANLMLAEPGASYNESFQQQLPFEVVMNIKGELLKPEIFFSIRLEESKRDALGGSVASRLQSLEQNESEMNKQVFALLILNSFIPSGSNSGNANLVANQARNSASQILTQQLNNLSDKFVQGIDFNMDLSSYGGAAGEGNTDLNVNVAKSFFDDRVTIRVGSSIALESNDAAQSSQQMMTNIEAEYKLTEDGRYRLKAFSKTDLEDIVVGRITRTGGGVIFQRDFNRFRNLFKPRKLSLEKEENDGENSRNSKESKTESD